jgi:hypothetical protein
MALWVTAGGALVLPNTWGPVPAGQGAGARSTSKKQTGQPVGPKQLLQCLIASHKRSRALQGPRHMRTHGSWPACPLRQPVGGVAQGDPHLRSQTLRYRPAGQPSPPGRWVCRHPFGPGCSPCPPAGINVQQSTPPAARQFASCVLFWLLESAAKGSGCQSNCSSCL